MRIDDVVVVQLRILQHNAHESPHSTGKHRGTLDRTRSMRIVSAVSHRRTAPHVSNTRPIPLGSQYRDCAIRQGLELTTLFPRDGWRSVCFVVGREPALTQRGGSHIGPTRRCDGMRRLLGRCFARAQGALDFRQGSILFLAAFTTSLSEGSAERCPAD